MKGHADRSPAGEERRAGGEDRRSRTALAIITGSWRGRRRNPRRAGPVRPGHIDWHAAQWLAVALLVLSLSLLDTLLTLRLTGLGARELNPVLAALLPGGGRWFVALKFLLTAATVVVLVILARVPMFGRRLAAPILLVTAALYLALVTYELWLLNRTLS